MSSGCGLLAGTSTPSMRGKVGGSLKAETRVAFQQVAACSIQACRQNEPASG